MLCTVRPILPRLAVLPVLALPGSTQVTHFFNGEFTQIKTAYQAINYLDRVYQMA